MERRRWRGEGDHSLVPIHPVVWKLGFTSLLTDISAEMVNSLLPVYLLLHLHMSPVQFGAIDGLYNGVALALLSLAGGFLADRTRRHKEVALLGYGLSAGCKLLLLAAGAAGGWIATILLLDRTGKGLRTAPRDAMISLANSEPSLARAFAVHRALDAGGALLGPMLAFVLLSQMPGRFDAVWVTSFVFALLGLAVLCLFVQNPAGVDARHEPVLSQRAIPAALAGRGFWTLACVGSLLAVLTVSDGFLYLLLQRRSNLTIGFFPLFYVITACCYMLFSIPIGRTADRWGRAPVFLCGYGVLGLIYLLLLVSPGSGFKGSLVCLLLFGLYYAATEGVLMAMASALIARNHRSVGLAFVGTLVGLGKVISSLLFGWLWQQWGTTTAVAVLGLGLILALPLSAYALRNRDETFA